MAMKDNFLREVKIGDNVELMIHTKEMTGTIVALDLDTARICRDTGKETVVSSGMISFYEVENKNLNTAFSIENVNENVKSDEKTVSEKSVEIKQKGAEKESIPVVASASVKVDGIDSIIAQINERGNSFFINIEVPIAADYKDIAKTVDNLALRNNMLAIANSIEYAIKQAHEISLVDYKIQENIGKIKRLIRNNPRSKAPQNMLAAVYLKCKCESLALETYENGNDNESAFAVADSLHMEEKTLVCCKAFCL